MTLHEVKNPSVNFNQFLWKTITRDKEGHVIVKYAARDNVLKCLYQEYVIDIDKHVEAFEATVRHITFGRQTLQKELILGSMRNGTFQAVRESFIYKRFQYRDQFGQIEASVSVGVRGHAVWAKITFKENVDKCVYIGSLHEPNRTLNEICKDFTNDFQEFFEKITAIRRENRLKGIEEPQTEDVEVNLCHSTVLMSEIKITEEGKTVFTVVVRFDEENCWVYADYFCPNEFPFYREYIKKLDKNDSIEKRSAEADKVKKKYKKEVRYSLGTLNELKIPFRKAIQNGMLVKSRKRFIVKKTPCFEKTNDEKKKFADILIYVLKSESEGYSKKEVFAEYTKSNGEIYTELLGDYARDGEDLKEIVKEFTRSFQETLSELKSETNKSAATLLLDGTYIAARGRYKVSRFGVALVEYLNLYNKVNEHLFANKLASKIDLESIISLDQDEKAVIADRDIPPIDLLIGLLFRSKHFKSEYSNAELPSMHKVIEAYRKVNTLRHRCIEFIKSDPFLSTYSLYNRDNIIAVRNDGEFTVFDEEHFQKVTRPPTPQDELHDLSVEIDDQFIARMIKENVVHASLKKKLEKYKGKVFPHALILDGPLFGNVNRILSLMDILVSSSEKVSETMSYFGVDDKGASTSEKKEERKNYKDRLTENIYKWLVGQVEFTQLGITRENSRKALNIVKFLELGQKMYNCQKADDKKSFERNCDDLKTKILEVDPSIKTHEAFTALLDTSDLYKCMEELVPSRNAQHAYIATMNLLMLRWASNFLEVVSGVGGNSASGKTTFTGGNTLSYDKWRYFLRKGTEILPSQDFAECSVRFNAFLKFIIEETDLKYTLDLRFLEPKLVQENIVDPAKRRMGKGTMIYLITPLQTSLLRMLTRSTYGPNPAQETWVISSGFKTLHKNFAAIVELMNKEEYISEYKIYYKHGTSQECIASKHNDQVNVLNQKIFDECKVVPSDEEIKRIEETVITQNMINEAVIAGEIFPEQAEGLKKYIGQKLCDAVNANARGGK